MRALPLGRGGEVRSPAPVVAAGFLFFLMACGDGPVEDADGSRWLEVQFTEEFHVGDEPSEHPFAGITGMAFAPDGRLLVLDRIDRTVTTYDAGGNQVGRWGRAGDGPGEFPNPPYSIAVSDEGVVAVNTYARLNRYSLDGEVIDSRPATPISIREIAFSAGNDLLAMASRGRPGDGSPTEIVRFADGETVWTFPPEPSFSGLDGGPFAYWGPTVVVGWLWDGSVAVGMSDGYDMQVLDASTGAITGRIARDVPLRGPSEAFTENLRQELAASYGEDSWRVERLAAPSPFPVVTKVLTGPPGRTIWVGRGAGVGDELAPPVGESMDDWTFRHYDLFDGDSYEYFGTVEVPKDFILMAADSNRIAGFQRDTLDVQSVRVMRVAVSPSER